MALILYLIAWALVVVEPMLWPVAVLGFLQTLAHTFVSRGRNSGSLTYHMVASIFSNGIYVCLLVFSINFVGYMTATSLPVFIAVFVLSTMSGSVTAHKMALRVERGKARNVQEDRLVGLETDVKLLKAQAGLPVEVDDSGLCTFAIVGKCALEPEVRAHTAILKGAWPDGVIHGEEKDVLLFDLVGGVKEHEEVIKRLKRAVAGLHTRLKRLEGR